MIILVILLIIYIIVLHTCIKNCSAEMIKKNKEIDDLKSYIIIYKDWMEGLLRDFKYVERKLKLKDKLISQIIASKDKMKEDLSKQIKELKSNGKYVSKNSN